MTDILETVAEGETLPHPPLGVVHQERAQPATLYVLKTDNTARVREGYSSAGTRGRARALWAQVQ
jgi:hypothetical protein